jgi:hypothetical protein
MISKNCKWKFRRDLGGDIQPLASLSGSQKVFPGGMESPISVSPAIASLGGRSAASTKLCTPISATAVPTAAPKIPYWTIRDPFAPVIAPTTTNNEAAHTATTTTHWARTRRPQA